MAEELFEEELDNLLRDDEGFHQVADALMEEIEKRFDLLPPGEVQKTRQGWPLKWSGAWPVEERPAFLRAISRFSSNYAPLFGQLLTPLVNGVRVAGPFTPTWNGNEVPKLILLDGEGLGHTPKSSSAVSTAVSRRIEAADAVLLVDSATQPMQAAPLAAMREVVATGNARKLIIAFTHFDEVKGDNLPNASAKVHHVLASAESVLAAFGEELGPYAERALRQRLERARFFFADIHEPLSEKAASGKRTISQIRKLLGAIDAVIERPEPAKVRPVYDRMNLVLAIRAAAEAFHEEWRPLLGLEFNPGFAKEHWTRVKALSRRLATGWADEYDTLRPIADLRKELVKRIYVFVQKPLRWEGLEPAEEQKQECFDAFADNLGRRLREVCTRRIWHERADAVAGRVRQTRNRLDVRARPDYRRRDLRAGRARSRRHALPRSQPVPARGHHRGREGSRPDGLRAQVDKWRFGNEYSLFRSPPPAAPPHNHPRPLARRGLERDGMCPPARQHELPHPAPASARGGATK